MATCEHKELLNITGNQRNENDDMNIRHLLLQSDWVYSEMKTRQTVGENRGNGMAVSVLV